MKLKNEIRRILAFGLVGVGATLIHLIFAQLALFATKMPMLSSLIGFVPAFVFSYLGHRHFTFSDAAHGSVFRFFVVAFSGFGFSVFVLEALETLQPWLALTVSIGVIPLWTYVMVRLWVFSFRRHVGQGD